MPWLRDWPAQGQCGRRRACLWCRAAEMSTGEGCTRGGVDIQPGAAWTKEMRKERTDRPTGARGAEEVALREEGAIEVSHEQGGYLHVEGMQVFPHELLPLLALRTVSLRFKRGIDGGEQQTVR